MTDAAVVCANHPDRETSLRCNRCGKPICAQCAILTPVGYRCKECVKGQQKVFETAQWVDYPIAAVLSGVGVGLAVGVLGFIGFWGILVAPIAGGALAEVVRWAVRRRRGRRLPLAAAGGGVLGMLVHLWLPAFAVALAFSGSLRSEILSGALFAVLFPVINGGLMVTTLYYRLKGIRFG
jgi:B-box zinc finger